MKFLVFTSLFIVISIAALGQCNCTHNLPANQYNIDGNALNVKPGDVLCLPAGNIGNKLFTNINGTKDKPVIIKNCGGLVYIKKPTSSSFGINFSRSSHFILTGTGDPGIFYGIEVEGSNQGIDIGTMSSDFEVDHIKVHNTGYAGFAIKTNPSCDPASWRENYSMDNIKIHDNYAYETTGEGYYIGNSHYHFQVDVTCSGNTIKVWEHSIRNADVYNNIAENTGRDGIQVGAVIEGGIIRNNRVNGFGLLNPDHINGIQVNPGFHGVVYNNYVSNGKGYGIQSLGNGITAFNNICEFCENGGLFADDRGTTPGVSFGFFNNTLIKNGRYGIYFLSEASVNNRFQNNIIVSDGSSTFKYSSKHPRSNLTVSNNIETADINSVKFTDVNAKNYKILSGSPAIDGGVDVSSFGISFDYDYKLRPSNAKYDMGAYEFQSQSLGVNAGSDQVITLPVNSTTITGAVSGGTGPITYSWSLQSGGAVTFQNENTATVTVSGLQQGVYVFELVASDGTNTASDLVQVTVQSAAVNQSPTANAGTNKDVFLPTSSLTITGSGSDPDGSIASYSWVKLSGPAVTIAGANTTNLQLTNLLEGTYLFELTVTDNQGATGSATVQVTVHPAAANQAPSVNAGTDKSVILPTNSINLTGTATDPDGSIATTVWTKRSGPATALSNANTLTLTASNLVEGTYIFRLTATDNLGLQSFDEVKVDVLNTNQNPVVSAGNDITLVLPTNSTNIVGNATDPDGSIASYLWEKVSGPGATLTNTSSATLTVTNLVVGNYTFRLTATDDDGASTSDDVIVNVLNTGTNINPQAHAGNDITITLPTNSAVLTGSGTDADGTVTAYLWTKKSGPTALLVNANQASVTVQSLVAGTYVFTLEVTDNNGAKGTDDVSVVVQPAATNQAPVANGGGNKFITLPTNATTLNGIGADQDGTITSYLWTKEQGPAATLTGANTADLSLSNLVLGTYIFKFTVTDNLNATGSDFVTVDVNAVNLNPIVSAGTDKVLVLPANSINLTGTASDPDGSIASVAWLKVTGPSVTMTGNSTLNLSLSNLVQGTYTFSLTATDNVGGSSVSTVQVDVLPVASSQLPVVNAGNDQVLFLPTNTANFNGKATDPDGAIASTTWTQISGPTATLINTNFLTLTVSDLVQGVYKFRLTATDDTGGMSFDEVLLTVNGATQNQLPIVSAGPNQAIQLPTNSINLSGSASDPDGSIVSYLWTKVSGPTGTMAGTTTSTLQLTQLIEGTYTFRLRATDNNGGSAFSDVKLNVLSQTVNILPIANAGQNQTIILPQNATSLVGSGNDPDGTIASYLWSKVSGPAVTSSLPTNQVLQLTDLLQGTYVFRLTVTDDDGAASNDDVTITVLNSASNLPPSANAGGNKIITLPTNTLNLFGSGSDPDGSIASYQWSKVSGGTATLNNATTPTLNVTNMTNGIYRFKLRVTDNGGLFNEDFAQVTVLAQNTNQPPLANAGPDLNVSTQVSSVSVNGSGSDSDGTIVEYKWEELIGATAQLTGTATPNLLVSNLTEGQYKFSLTVTDNLGSTDTDEMLLNVTSNFNIPPVVNAGTDVTLILPANTTTLTATSSDPDGSIASLFWQKISGPTATLSDPTLPSLTLQDLVEGIYNFKVTAIDNNNTSVFDNVTVTVLNSAVNSAPVANAGADQNITLPTNSITINGTATDADGTIASVVWSKTLGGAATLTNSNTLDLQVSNMVEGVYEFELKATDNSNAIGSDKVRVTVLPIPPNQLPVVNAGENVTLILPQTNPIVFTGTATDADGTIAGYEWTKVSGPAATLANTTTADLTVTNVTTVGLYVFRLTATDDQNGKSFDDVLLFVSESSTTEPQNPVAYAGEDALLVLPENSTVLIGEGADPDGFVVTYTWSKENGGNVIMDQQGNQLLLSDLGAGTYDFKLTVIDNDNLEGSDLVTLVVTNRGESLIIPKYYSPNNDGVNDTWEIGNHESIQDCLLQVYTRSGQLVYEKQSYDNSWNGNSSDGKALIDGDYYYVIKCGSETVASGGVRIIR